MDGDLNGQALQAFYEGRSYKGVSPVGYPSDV